MKKIILIFFLMIGTANAEVLWEDDFNGFTSGWTPSIAGAETTGLYPWTTDETYDPEDPADNGGGLGITDYEPSIYAPGQRKNSNSWNGWTQNNNSTGAVSIQSTGGVDNSPALRIRLIKHTGLGNETGIHKWLGNTHYQEVYIQYKIKFGSTAGDWWWNGQWIDGDSVDENDSPTGIIWKLGRAWTGFNPTDIDKTLGQTQPVVNTTWSHEANWRTGIWIPGLISNPYSYVDNTLAFIISDFHWEVSCPDGGAGTCDSQNNPRNEDGYRDWIRYSDNLVPTTSKGMIHNFTGALDTTTGATTENQTFHTIEMRLKNRSTPATADGAYQLWIDGTEITSDCVGMASNLVKASMSADADDYGMNFIRFVDNFNHLTTNIPDSPGYMDLYIEDIVISTTPIGPDYVIGGGGGSSTGDKVGPGTQGRAGAGTTIKFK